MQLLNMLFSQALSQTCAFPSFISPSCSVCPSYCTTCSSSGCSRCYSGYNLIGGNCLPCATYCLTCSGSVCSSCFEGFYFQDGSCQFCGNNVKSCTKIQIQSCLIGYYEVGYACSPCQVSKNCLACLSSLQCSSCNPSFTLVSPGNGAIYCAPLCSNVAANAGCSSCLQQTIVASCAVCSSCSDCLPGFKLSGQLCVSDPSICTGTKFMQNGECKTGASILCAQGATSTTPFSCNPKCPDYSTPVSQTGSSQVACMPLPLYNYLYQLYLTALSPPASVQVANSNCFSIPAFSNQITLFLPGYSRLIVQLRVVGASSSYSYTVTITDNTTVPRSSSSSFQASSCADYRTLTPTTLNERKVVLRVQGAQISELLLQYRRCLRGCLVCANDQFCYICDPPLALFEFKCLPSCTGSILFFDEIGLNQCRNFCPPRYYSGTANSLLVCLLCQSPCINCLSLSQCLSCQPRDNQGRTLYFNGPSSQCLISCPSNYYPDSQSLLCVRCVPPCLTCLSFSQCLTCSSFYFYQNSCVINCPSNMFGDPSANVCSLCSTKFSNCVSCTATICRSCATGFINYLNSCTRDCSVSSQVFLDCSNPSARRCTDCSVSQGCFQCRSQTECTTNPPVCIRCSLSYFLYQSRCTNLCPDAFYGDTQSGSCQSCSSLASCLACSSAVTCTSCMTGFYLSILGTCLTQNGCLTIAPSGSFFISGLNCVSCNSPCLTCLDGSRCLSCLTGFLSENSCNSFCPSGTYINTVMSTCTRCEGACLTCTSPTYCLSCSQNLLYLATNNTCVSTCPSGFYRLLAACERCLSPCIVCSDANTCSQCLPGMALQGISCVSVCLSNFLLRTVSQVATCQPCLDPCLTCTGQLTKCTSCKTGFLNNFRCQSSCPDTTYQQPNKCKSCIRPCLTCSSAVFCLSCIVGRLANGQCVNNCPQSQYLDGTECKNCQILNCKICTAASNCLTCSGSLYLSGLKNNCVLASECNVNQYANPQSQTCQLCSSPCNTCNNLGCLSCSIGYISLTTYSCMNNCPDGKYGSNNACLNCHPSCATCLSTQLNCKSCFNNPSNADDPNNKYLLGSVCTPDCNSNCGADSNTPCYYKTSGYCVQCYFPCRNCNNQQNSCTTCLAGFLQANSCVSLCSIGTYPDSQKICRSCDSNCYQCSVSSTNCTSCKILYLYNNRCREACPDLFFSDVLSFLCVSCASPCKRCSSLIECIDCVGALLFFQSSCIASCPSGFYSNQVTCLPCNQALNCYECTGPQACSSCELGFFMSSSGCVSTCPSLYFADAKARVCAACNLPCVQCISVSDCTTCIQGYILVKTSCIIGSDCPQGFYRNPSGLVCSQTCPAGYVGNPLNNLCVERCPPSYFNNFGICSLDCKPNSFKNSSMSCFNCTANLPDCSSPLQFRLSLILNYSRITLIITFSSEVQYPVPLTNQSIAVWAVPQAASRLLLTALNFTILQQNSRRVIIQLRQSYISNSYVFVQLPTLGQKAVTFTPPSSGLLQITTQSQFVPAVTTYPQSTIDYYVSTFYKLSLSLSFIAVVLLALLSLLELGDLTRHLTDQVQTLWILAYVGSAQTVNFDAFTRGFFGAVFGVVRPSFPNAVTGNKISIVDGDTRFAVTGVYLLVVLLCFTLIALGVFVFRKTRPKQVKISVQEPETMPQPTIQVKINQPPMESAGILNLPQAQNPSHSQQLLALPQVPQQSAIVVPAKSDGKLLLVSPERHEQPLEQHLLQDGNKTPEKPVLSNLLLRQGDQSRAVIVQQPVTTNSQLLQPIEISPQVNQLISVVHDIFYLVAQPFFFYAVCSLLYSGGDASSTAASVFALLLTLLVLALCCGYVVRDQAGLRAGSGLRTFHRCQEQRAGYFIILGRYARKFIQGLVVAITFTDQLYSLGMALLINVVMLIILAFYRPYKNVIQDYLNIAGEVLICLVLLVNSILINTRSMTGGARIAAGYAGIVFELLVLLQVVVQAIALLVILIYSLKVKKNYINIIFGNKVQEVQVSIQDSQNMSQASDNHKHTVVEKSSQKMPLSKQKEKAPSSRLKSMKRTPKQRVFQDFRVDSDDENQFNRRAPQLLIKLSKQDVQMQ